MGSYYSVGAFFLGPFNASSSKSTSTIDKTNLWSPSSDILEMVAPLGSLMVEVTHNVILLLFLERLL